MTIIYQIHSVFGQRVLPLLIVLAAVYLVITWRPGQSMGAVARLFPFLVYVQVLLGLVVWIVGIAQGNSLYLSFPFVLHPLLGLVAASVAGRSVKPSNTFLRGWGRWAPLAPSPLLLLIVVSAVAMVYAARG